MNILPKKRWHVRTKENIARVRRDEAKAAEEEKQKQLRVEIAEREARTELLRKRARKNKPEPVQSTKKAESNQQGQHINFFYELEENSFAVNKSNPEYEKEKKLEKEKYEKQIGYLTYLGQDTNEITGNVSWYNVDPKERNKAKEEVAKDKKALEDPLREIRKYLGTDDVPKSGETSTDKSEKVKKEKSEVEVKSFGERLIRDYGLLKEKKKSKKSKKKKKKKRRHSSDSDGSESDEPTETKPRVDIEALREKRLKREMEERKRAEMILAKARGDTIKEEKINPEIEQKYNSQFNPHLAKQNQAKR